MKTAYRLIASLALLVSLGTPLIAGATVGDGMVCVSPIECTSGVCTNAHCVGGVTVNGPSSTGSSGSGGINDSYLQGYKNSIIGVINGILVPVLMAIAFIVFLWGVFKYFIYGANDPKGPETGRQFVFWGIIGFVVIVSVWALVNLVMGTLGLAPTSHPPPTPTL